MPKPEFGKKVICNNCDAKFYDLNRKPATCPHCGTEYVELIKDAVSTTAKQVFIENVDTVSDDNLVGSDAAESIADVSDIDSELDIDNEIDEDTISLEDSESVGQAISDDDININIDTVPSTEDTNRD
tara:strand:+ start:3071 stop:3454 length:384 start_codon:yes stop_codon:yes gene_type:complete